jgi:hypothetical protein
VLAELGGDSLGEICAAPHDSNEDDAVGAIVALRNLECDALDRASDLDRVEGDFTLAVQRRAPKKSRARKKTWPRAQPGRLMIVFVMFTFSPSRDELKAIRIYRRAAGRASNLAIEAAIFEQDQPARLRSSLRRR